MLTDFWKVNLKNGVTFEKLTEKVSRLVRNIRKNN